MLLVSKTPEHPFSAEIDAPGPAPRTKTRVVAAAGILAVVLIGLNLRAGISSASALFHDLQQVLGYGAWTAALLPSIPTLCFAVAGAGTSWLVRRVGVEKAIAVALFALTAGLALRAVPSVGMLLLGTVVSMSGLAVCNVAMPSFIREHYSDKTATMTGVYTITMSLGATMSAAVSVPLALQLDSPSLGLAAWAVLSVVTLAAFVPIALAAHRRRSVEPAAPISPWSLLKTRTGLLITAFFTIQAIAAYSIISWLPTILIAAGLEPAEAGLLLGLAQVVTVVGNVALLALAGRPGGLRRAFMVASVSYLLGAVALLVLPVSAAVVTSLLLGLGFGVFALVLVVISRSGGTTAEATAMSTLAQSVGYLLGTLGPFGMGLAHTLSGGWSVPLMMLVGVAAVQVVLAWLLTARRGDKDAAADEAPSTAPDLVPALSEIPA
ncbi:MFS transporter [Arthrobacter glacialis]|uniref:MFS transporter n=1 Tax=Arthrobacter glacialis TaxID=1664 RepID=A0A2S3ZZC8_ARTGL|nr:MFS transporter [Arthrobacter glacialis]